MRCRRARGCPIDCEALDAAQVFGFAMKHPVAWRIEASSTLS